MVSDNVVSVRLNEAVGPERTAEHARKFGFKGPIKPYLSLALGTSEVSPLEMASAMGVRQCRQPGQTVAVLKVTDIDGGPGGPSAPDSADNSVPEAYITTECLPVSCSRGNRRRWATWQAFKGKTGTTQEYRDAWFAGYTPELSCAVWVGYDSPTRSVGLPGGSIAGPIWANFMGTALKDRSPKEFRVPQGIVRTRIDLDNGLIATENCPRTIEAAFLTGSEPKEVCYEHQQQDFWWNWDNWLGENDSSEGKKPAPRMQKLLEWWKSRSR